MGDVKVWYERWRLLEGIRSSELPVAGYELLGRWLFGPLRPAAGTAAVEAEVELLMAMGAPVEVVGDDPPRFCWVPDSDDPHRVATERLWPLIREEARRGWRGRDAVRVETAVALVLGGDRLPRLDEVNRVGRVSG